MKAYDLKPTYENLLETYRKDMIERNADVFRFITILNSIEDGCAVAVDGNWGSGKTFFVKQVKMVMDAHNTFISSEQEGDREEIVSIRNRYCKNNAYEIQPQVCVYYDAWENDNDEDPVLSLVYAILNSVNTDYSFKDRDYIKAGASLMELFTGKSWTQVVENLKSSTPFDSMKESRDIKARVDEFLDSLLPERGNRLVIFVDELDRCKPSYAVRLLERIKHYFDHDRITFVFSVNTNELQHTIRKHYGQEFDGSRYLDRFFDLRVTLPPPNLDGYYRNLHFNNTHYVYDAVCDAVIKEFHFELREIAKFLRLTRIAAHNITHGKREFIFPDGRGIEFCVLYIVPIMIGLRVSDAQRYTDFIQGKDGTPLIDIIGKSQLHGSSRLLGNKETYDKLETQKTLVTLEDKLKDVYNALFATKYDGMVYHTYIGEYEFNANTKKMILEIAGLLSPYTNPDLD